MRIVGAVAVIVADVGSGVVQVMAMLSTREGCFFFFTFGNFRHFAHFHIVASLHHVQHGRPGERGTSKRGPRG